MRGRRSPDRRWTRVPLALATCLLACTPEQLPTAPESDEERTSYAIGLHLGGRLRETHADLDPDAIADGFARGMQLATPARTTAVALDPREIEVELAKLAEGARAHARTAHDALARANERAGAAFLADNRTQPGVVELPSGVQYRVLAGGEQPPPAVADRVTVEYEGRLLDGAVFDTSKDRAAPTIVRLARTPRPWREVLPLVPGGATVEVWAPGALEPAEHPVGLVPAGELVVFTLRVAAIDRHHNPDVARGPP